jgi:hypothetical protein
MRRPVEAALAAALGAPPPWVGMLGLTRVGGPSAPVTNVMIYLMAARSDEAGISTIGLS